MIKNFLKKTIKLTIGLNVLTVGFGLFSFYGLHDIMKDSERADYNNIRSKLKEKNITYESFKNKFLSQNQDDDKDQDNNIDSREKQIKKLENDNFDILIIGGGSAGAGVLIDAYTRGLKCGLIEVYDFASGTSSRSSKLIHGGLRYLEEAFSFDMKVGIKERLSKIALVNEALNERNFVRTSAIFMNKSLELVIKANDYLSLLYYYNGVFLYQILYMISWDSKKAAKSEYYFMPLKLDLYRKKIYLYEGQFNDSRQNLLSIFSCCTKNYIQKSDEATAANYIEFKSYIYNKENEIIGVKVFDKINNKEFDIRSKVVVNCTGIYSDDNFTEDDKMRNKMIKASKGSHLILKDLNLEESIMIPKTSDGRVLFVVPYENYFLAGTTDKEQIKDLHPNVLEEEESFIIKEMADYLKDNYSEEELRKKITSKWAGERPLVCEEGFNGNTNSKSISRSHVIHFDKKKKLYSLMGGKWTTYRNMGKELVDKIIENEPDLKKKQIENRNSKYFKLKGSIESYIDKYNKKEYRKERLFFKDLLIKLEGEYSELSRKTLKELIKRHGIYSIKILLDGEKSKTNKILFGNFLESEVRYTIKNEMAMKPNDIICRRLGIGFLDDQLGLSAIPIIANIIGDELKLSNNEVNRIIDEANKSFYKKL